MSQEVTAKQLSHRSKGSRMIMTAKLKPAQTASSFVEELNENIRARQYYPSKSLIAPFNLGSNISNISKNKNATRVILTNTLTFSTMNQHQQQHQQAFTAGQQQTTGLQQAAFPNLPMQISSTSSLNSTNASSISSYGVSPTPVAMPNASFPAPMAAHQVAAAPTGAAGFMATAASQLQPQQALSAGLAQHQQHQHQHQHQHQAVVQQVVPITYMAQRQQQPTNTLLSLNNSIYTTASGLTAAGNSALGPLLQPTSLALAASGALGGGSVPEFLYQLTKMLTDPNRDIIEWSTYSGNGRIEVHHPARLEKEVLGRYFRHSKYSSFQRQLNYFGFRKIAGKGKMSPCSYVNEAATTDIRSLLLMKRKNSKEKERELQLEREKREREAGAVVSGGWVASGSVGSVGKRPNPGDDIKPATVQPMFTTSATAVQQQPAVNATVMAPANHGAMNITSSMPMATHVMNNQVNGLPSNGLLSPNDLSNPNKRARPNPASNEGRGYTVAIGKGVKHQLNGYLRVNAAAAAVTATSTTATASGVSATSTIAAASSRSSSSSKNISYLSHPSARQASAAPAPLQFLDPSELGMSIENSLSQLKDNFALATAGSAAGSTAAATDGQGASTAAAAATTTLMTHSGSATASSTNSSNNSLAISSIKYAPSALTRRVSDANFLGGMLSRDDSLINLAMLPTLDNDTTASNGASTNNGGGEGSNAQTDYMASIFSRDDDSLVNFAGAVDMSSSSTATSTAQAKQESDETTMPGDGSNDTFGFIDFQS